MKQTYSMLLQTSQDFCIDPGTAADYDTCGAVSNPTEGATRVDLGSITTSAYNTWTFNATGRGWVSSASGSVLKIGVREGHDALNSALAGGNGSSSKLEYNTVYSSNDPVLTVTWLLKPKAIIIF